MSSPLRPMQVLVIAWVCALSAAAVELGIIGYDKYIRGEVIGFGPSVIWMTPLAYTFLFLIPAAILLAASRWRPQLLSLFRIVFIFALLTYLSVLLGRGWLHPLAALLLAAGLGLQTARLVAAPPQRLTAWVQSVKRRIGRDKRQAEMGASLDQPGASQSAITRRGFLVAAGATMAGLTLGDMSWRGISERYALSQLPSPKPGLPNVLLIVLDTVRAQSTSLHGYPLRTMPLLERWAKKGVMFEWAISTAPWTLPSHASMFTGKYPHQLSADWTTPLDGAHPTLAEILSRYGYETAGFVANLVYASAEHGLARGFSHYEDYPLSLGQLALSSELSRYASNRGALRRLVGYHDVLNRKSAADINRAFLDWVTRRDARRPFFGFLNYYDAHEPYLPPAPFREMFGPVSNNRRFDYMTGEVERPRKWEMSPAEIETERAAYDGAIAYMDHELNALLEQLEQRGLADTLVIITSDHGEQHGEHGLFSHGNSLYMQTLHVPLVMTWRGHIPANRTVSQIISLRDIPSTILDLINLPAAPSFGNSLRRYWEPNAQIITADTPILSAVSKGFGEAWYPNSKGDMRSIAMEGIHYIQSGDGGMEAYALAHDPLELNAMPLPADVQRTVSKELSKWFDAAGKESRAAGVKQP